MKRTVYQFPRARSGKKLATQRRLAAGATSIELLKMVEELRSDLRSIENAIMAVEYLAELEFGHDAVRIARSRLRKGAKGAEGRAERPLIAPRPSRPRQMEPVTPDLSSG